MQADNFHHLSIEDALSLQAQIDSTSSEELRAIAEKLVSETFANYSTNQ